MALVIPDHPQRWRRAVTPGDLAADTLTLVAGGAVAPGARVDALVAIDHVEVARRDALDAGPVESATVLDVLLGLPLGYPVAVADLSAREQQILTDAPAGCVELGSTVSDGQLTPSVTRTLRAPLTVVAAVVRGSRWRASVRRAASFYPLAQRVVVVPAPPDAVALAEARLAGVGIWIEQEDGFEEHLPAEPFAPKYIKAAGWRFAENAYRAAVEQSLVGSSDPESADRTPRPSERSCC